MSQYLRAYAERAAETPGKMGEPIRYVASTENVARDGMIITADAWQLENFRKNPVVLFSHDYFSRPPIGKVTNIEVRDNQLMADVVFDQDDPFAVMIEKKVRAGVMNACSVGWDTLSFEPPNGPNVAPRVTKADLLDFSVVPVPSDPDGLKARQQRGLADMAHNILNVIESDTTDTTATTDPIATTTPPADSSARATWDDIAPQMVRLMTPFAQRPDDERKADWGRLVREYERLRKTPPEFIPQAELDALGIDEVRGLFLEGEPETFASLFDGITSRAGAVLSQRNRSDLDQAISLIQGVLERSKGKPADDEPTDDERAAAFLQELANGIAGDAA